MRRVHRAVDGQWVRRNNNNSVSPVDRESLVYGQYMPIDKQNCGLIDESILTPWNDPSATLVTLPDGIVLENKIIYGDVRPPSTQNNDIIFRNCLFRGGADAPSIVSSVIYCSNRRLGTGKVYVYDSEIRPQRIALNRDGIRGNRWEAHRMTVRDVVDAYGPHADTATNGGHAYVKIAGCIGERLAYKHPDYINGTSGPTIHSDGTHNDVVQIHGGRTIHVIGCYLNGSSVTMPGSTPPADKPWLANSGWARGGVIASTNDTDVAPDNTVIIEYNWLRGGLSHVNTKVGQLFIFRHNRHFHDTAVGPTHNGGYWFRFDYQTATPNHATVTGINVAGTTTINNTTNVWWDSPNAGEPLNTPRASGIHFNTAP